MDAMRSITVSIPRLSHFCHRERRVALLEPLAQRVQECCHVSRVGRACLGGMRTKKVPKKIGYI
jgi:hypothetical protein